MTKMILYKSCFGETQQKIKFEINLKKLLTNEISYGKILKLLLEKVERNKFEKVKKVLDKQKTT